jgi:HK97 family phage prohead protease
MPALPSAPEVPVAPQEGTPVQNSGPTSATFSSESFTNEQTISFSTEDFAADGAKRTVSGVLIPFDAVGRNGQGKWRFEAGSVEWQTSAVSKVKLNREHDRKSLVGAATALKATDTGISAQFKVGRGPLADQALADAEDSILDGLSAEVDILDYIKDPADASVFLVKRARLTGAALTGSPAFDDARLTSVAASATSGTETEMTEATPATQPEAVTLSAVEALLTEKLAALAPAQTESREIVNPNRAVALSVTEASPYRFNGQRGQYDFSTDLFASARDASGEAAQRVQKFISTAFADVSTDDVNELNPTRNRADLYVDNLAYEYPIWDAINKGSIPDATPFTVPKFSSASGLVAAHTEATEPNSGTFVTTSQTITPGRFPARSRSPARRWTRAATRRSPRSSGTRLCVHGSRP